MGAPGPAGETLETRLDRVIVFLAERGYVARWEHCPEGTLLQTYNCPYREIADGHPALCIMDLRLMSELLDGRPLKRVTRVVEGAPSCSYLIPAASEEF